MRAYRANTLRDAWIDGKGRLWYTTNPETLPKDPRSFDTVPDVFQRPDPVPDIGEAPSTARAPLAMQVGHAFAERHVASQKAAGLGRDSKAFYLEWGAKAEAVAGFTDWQLPTPTKPRELALTDTEMGLVLTYALAACGYDGKGLGLWGRGPIVLPERGAPRHGEP